MTDFAFVTGGCLHVSLGGTAPRRLTSAFADDVRDRARDIHRRHAWKGEGSQGGFGAIAWGRQPAPAPSVDAMVTGVTRGPSAGHLMYALEIDRLTAVCASDPRGGPERRLLHGASTRIRDLCARPGREEIACALVHADGTASIALMSHEATDLRQVTEGDSLDLLPAWADDGSRRIVYQSAGLGRDASGRPAGFGAFEVHVLHTERGELETVASDPNADLERPRIGADGALYYLSRPHGRAQGSALATIKAVLLLPVRLLYALFQYLNFFSARYTGKPLMTAGGPSRRAGDLRRMLEWANLAQAQQDGDADDDSGGVPRSHRLLRRRPNEGPEVLAQGVACYDLADDGSILYATGTAVFRRDPEGRAERMCDASGVNTIVIL